MSADTVSLRISAAPEQVYDLITDVEQMGRWSPECVGGAWLGGATRPAVGAQFKGRNKRGRVRWSTTNTVIAAERGREFAFETKQSGMRWRYRFEPDGATGTLVTESREPWRARPAVARFFTQLLLGGEDAHAEELRQGMRATLERVKDAAEAQRPG
jgi:uncharacterized protein YndB with AHSA1/START domain